MATVRPPDVRPPTLYADWRSGGPNPTGPAVSSGAKPLVPLASGRARSSPRQCAWPGVAVAQPNPITRPEGATSGAAWAGAAASAITVAASAISVPASLPGRRLNSVRVIRLMIDVAP